MLTPIKLLVDYPNSVTETMKNAHFQLFPDALTNTIKFNSVQPELGPRVVVHSGWVKDAENAHEWSIFHSKVEKSSRFGGFRLYKVQ